MAVKYKKVDRGSGMGPMFDPDTIDLLTFIADVADIDGDKLMDRFLKTVLYNRGSTTIDKNKSLPILALFKNHQDKLLNLYNEVDDADLAGDIGRKQRLFGEITTLKNVIKTHVESQLLK